MKKRIFGLLLLAVMLVPAFASAEEAPAENMPGFSNNPMIHNLAYNTATVDGGVKVFMNGGKLTFDSQPLIINDRTMVPVAKIFNVFGYDVEWEPTEQRITAKRINGDSIVMWIGKTEMIVTENDKERTMYMPTAPVISESRTLVPVRAVSDALHCDIKWYGDKQLVSIVAN